MASAWCRFVLKHLTRQRSFHGSKVIDDDTIRIVTVMLRYNPKHEEAVEPLREWVNLYNVK